MKHSSVKQAVGYASRGTRLTCSRPGRNLVSFPLAYSPVRRQIGARRARRLCGLESRPCLAPLSVELLLCDFTPISTSRAGVSCRCCVRPMRTGHQGGERARHLLLGCAGGAKRPGLHREREWRIGWIASCAGGADTGVQGVHSALGVRLLIAHSPPTLLRRAVQKILSK